MVGVSIRVLVVYVCAAAGLMLAPRPVLADPDDPPTMVCGAVDGVLPSNIRLPKLLRSRVAVMLQRSPTFREQCRRIAEAPSVHVDVRPDLRFMDLRSVRATTVFRRRRGVLEADVALHPVADAALWLSHEFEHVIEQIEHANLAEMMRQDRGAWRAGPGVYETARAVRAGRTVFDEVREFRSDHRRAD